MVRRLTATCTRCQNRFRVEADTADGSPAEGFVCRCPRCMTTFPVACGEGGVEEVSTPWAIRATPAGAH